MTIKEELLADKKTFNAFDIRKDYGIPDGLESKAVFVVSRKPETTFAEGKAITPPIEKSAGYYIEVSDATINDIPALVTDARKNVANGEKHPNLACQMISPADKNGMSYIFEADSYKDIWIYSNALEVNAHKFYDQSDYDTAPSANPVGTLKNEESAPNVLQKFMTDVAQMLPQPLTAQTSLAKLNRN